MSVSPLARIVRRHGVTHIPRRLPKLQQPNALRMRYFAGIRGGILKDLRKLVEQHLVPELPRLAAAGNDKGHKADADDREKELGEIIDEVGAKLAQKWTREKIGALSSKIGDDLAKFHAGQMNRQLYDIAGVDVVGSEPWLGKVIQTFTAENVALIKSLPSTAFDRIEKTLTGRIADGDRWESMAEDIKTSFGVTESRANLIARDQVGKLYGDLNRVRQQEVGFDGYIWRTMNDNRVRDEHEERNGQRFQWDDPPEDGNPGEPINCVPGDAPVRLFGRAVKAYRRRFTGELTRLVTASGETLRVTPNHPVLTQSGWKAAQLVEVGEHLVRVPSQIIDLGVEDPQSADAQAEQVFGALAGRGIAHRAHGTAAGFHGDGTDQQVDVVSVDRGLIDEGDPALVEPTRDHVLTFPAKATSRSGDLPHDLVGLGFSPHGVVGSGSPGEALLGSGASLAVEHGGAAAPDLDAAREEHLAHWPARALESFGDFFLADAVEIQPDDFQFVEVQSVVHEAFDGWVYNFETSGGWFSAHGLIVHNCRCYGEPDLKQLLDDEGITSTGEQD